MDIYCGTDIIEVLRVKEAILRTPGFKEKIYTKDEILYAESKGELVKYEHYAGRFAAKEAVYKAISNIDNKVEFNQIEIINDKENKNRPVARINKANIEEMFKAGKLTIEISISHVKEYATAVASIKVLS